eukprot:jgi/Antlo1/198/107
MSTLYVLFAITFLFSSINLTARLLERCTVSALSSGRMLMSCVPRQHSTCIPMHTILCRYIGCFLLSVNVVMVLSFYRCVLSLHSCTHLRRLDDAPSSLSLFWTQTDRVCNEDSC